jgi:hypothetical protein
VKDQWRFVVVCWRFSAGLFEFDKQTLIVYSMKRYRIGKCFIRKLAEVKGIKIFR